MNVPPENQLTNCGGIVYKQDYFMNEINNLAAMVEEDSLGNKMKCQGSITTKKAKIWPAFGEYETYFELTSRLNITGNNM